MAYYRHLTRCLFPEGQLCNQTALWALTGHYFKEKHSLALRVPSVLVLGEFNYLLNPEHKSFNLIKCVEIEETIKPINSQLIAEQVDRNLQSRPRADFAMTNAKRRT
jgi:hypothetical protein